jgi:GxxExxY protein
VDENELSRIVIGGAIEVHRALGPGLLESAYEACLAHELTERGLAVERQKPVGVTYKGVSVECGFRVDLWVNRLIILEIKAVDQVMPIHCAQLLTYLRLTSCKLGLVLNFNERVMHKGIERVVNNL